MKKATKIAALMVTLLAFTACANEEDTNVKIESEPIEQTETVTETSAEETTAEGNATEETTSEESVVTSAEETTEETLALNPADYVGHYNNEGDDVMDIELADDGSYKISVFLYKLWGDDEAVLSVEGDKMVFDSEDGNGEAIKCAVYPEDGTLTFELLDANWTYFKTGDKFTGFTLAQ